MNPKQTIYFEITIAPHHAGFGMYQLGERHFSPESAYADESDLLSEIEVSFLPLDEALTDPNFIVAGVEDIRGKIDGGDPEQIFANIQDEPDNTQSIHYFGIESAEVPAEYWA